MALQQRILLALSVAATLTVVPAAAQETPELPAAPVPVEQGASSSVAPDAPAAAATVLNEDEMADVLNSRQQIKQGVTLTKSVDGKIIETKKETITYSKEDPIRSTEAGMSPLERMKAEFDSELLTRREALEEAKLDFVVADLDRSESINADEFAFLVKGWQDAEISGAGSGRFVDPVFHVDQAEADAEHAAQARAKFVTMAGVDLALGKKAFARKVIEEFEAHDLDDDELLRGDELLAFRASVRGESVDPR